MPAPRRATPPLPFRGWLAGLRRGIDHLPETRWQPLWLVALCLLLFLPGFFSIQPLDPDEARTAVTTRQMLDSGDLLHLRLGRGDSAGVPIGIHWAQAATVRGLEVMRLAHRSGIPAYRLTALLATLLAVLATWHWGRGLVGRQAAFLGAVMLAGSAAVVAAAHVATADAALLAAITLSMGLLGAARCQPQAFGAGQAALFWLAVAAGVLLQGPVALLVPLLAGASLGVLEGTAPWLRALRPGWGVPLLLAVLLPCFTAIGLATEGRAAVQMLVGGGWGLPGLHALTFAATAFPAAWIVLLALPGAWRDRADPAVRVLLAWAAAAWLVSEVLMPLPHPALPAFPPLMLLAARWALDAERPGPSRWLAVTAGLLLAGVAAAIGLGALSVAALDLREAPYGVLATLAAGLLAWRLLAHGRGGAWARAGMLGTLLAAPLYASVLQGTFSHLLVGRAADRIAGTAHRVVSGLPPERFGVLGFHGASLLFAYGPDIHLLEDAAAAARFLAAGPGRVVAIADATESDFYRAAAALGLTPRQGAEIMCYDYQRSGFVVMLFFRLEPPPGG